MIWLSGKSGQLAPLKIFKTVLHTLRLTAAPPMDFFVFNINPNPAPKLICRSAAYICLAECSHHSAMQIAVVDTKSALGRILAYVQAEEAERAQQGLAILLACALGEWPA